MGSDTTALVKGLVLGVGALIVLALVVFVVVSTLDDADLLSQSRVSAKVVNETVASVTELGTVLSVYDYDGCSATIVHVLNSTSATTIPSTNYSTSGCTIYFIGADNDFGYNNTGWNVTYTHTPPTTYERATTGMGTNFTSGIGNISSKIPTILLIGAVVILFGVIIFLIRQSQSMGLGGSGGGSL